MKTSKIPVVYYHSVAPHQHPSWSKKYLTVPLSSFEVHLKYLQKMKYKTITMSEYVQLRESDNHCERYIALTFDDGYLDNFVYVYPLLKRYGMKGTIFVNPESVPKLNALRPSLIDYWEGRVGWSDLRTWGFTNWDEMRIMERSGVIDIQSHTLNHAKYFVSDKIVDFHRPGVDSFYYTSNVYPDRLPGYITDDGFNKLLPYGYPVFEQKSAIIAERVMINQSFVNEVVTLCKDVNWRGAGCVNLALAQIQSLYETCRKENSIIERKESPDNYHERVTDNIQRAKEIIDKQVSKETQVCCWPHGDNNLFAHNQALKAGFRITTIGKEDRKHMDLSRFDRLGLPYVQNNAVLTITKVHPRLMAVEGRSPYKQIKSLYHRIKGVK